LKKKTIRLLVSIAGHADPAHELPDFAFAPGDLADVSAALAKAWIEGGIAEAIEPAPTPKKKK
jgi:hypothetical protein